MQILLILLLIQIHAIVSHNLSLVRDKRASCTPRVKIKGCISEPHFNKIFTYYHYYQGAEVIPGCHGNKMEKIVWSMYFIEKKMYINLDKYNNKMTVSFIPGHFYAGDYIMTLKITEAGGNTGTQSCKFRFITEPPVLIFKYGSSRKLIAGTNYKVDLTESINYDKLHPLKLTYSITCYWNNKTECQKENCVLNPEGGQTGMQFSLHADECHAKHQIIVSVWHDGNIHKKSQVNYVRKFYHIDTEIICHKNCDSVGSKYSNPNLPIHFQLQCNKNCSYLVVQKWNIKETDLAEVGDSVDPSLYNVLEENKVVILPNALKVGVIYWIICIIKGGSNYREIRLTPGNINNLTCDIQPRSGESLKTEFKVTCNTTEYLLQYAPFYQLYQDPSTGTKKGIMLAASAYNSFEVIIASIKNQPIQKLVILGHDMFYNKFEVSLPKITVSETTLNKDDIKKYLNKIDQMYNEGNGDLAGKYTQAFLTELSNKGIKGPMLNNVYSRLMTSMNKLDIDSIYAYKQIVTFLPHFYKNNKLDLNTKEQLALFCKQLSKVQLLSLLASTYASAAEGDVKQFTSITRTCADALIDNRNNDEEINVTNPDYVITEPTIEENYANYDNVFINSQIEQIKKNTMNTILNSARAIAETLIAGEYYDKEHENFESAVMVNEARLWPNKEIIINGTSVKIVDDMKKYSHETIGAVVTGYKQEFLESDKMKLDSNIVDIAFFVKKKNKQTKIPVKFELEMDVKVGVEAEDFAITVKGNLDEWEDHNSINVHRINIEEGRQCMLSFENIKSSDKLLYKKRSQNNLPESIQYLNADYTGICVTSELAYSDLAFLPCYLGVGKANHHTYTGSKNSVVLTIGRRPNLDDYQDETTYFLDGKKSDKYDINFVPEHKGDAFAYVGVLPHPDMITDSNDISVGYHVTFIEESCLIFDPIPYTWVPGPCEAKITFVGAKPKIKCTCTHSSLFGANVKPVEQKLDNINPIEFTTESFVNYNIFICVCVVFTCYCIALSFYYLRYNVKGGRDRVFFLSDNLKNDRFGYLVIVKTGSIDNSGTTSNIAFKIHGEKFTCKPHVFNYPDPQKILLQTGTTDCYILSTEKFMGKIDEIYLWFDSIGLRPSWYCERITVIDLQMQDYYYFNVEQWLTVLNTEQVYLKVHVAENYYDATKNVANHVKKCVRIYAGAFHTWNIVNKSHDFLFEYTERLTVILSMIYTTYVLNVLFLYVPNMRLSDAYGVGQLVFHYQIIVYGVCSSLLACLINYPFIFFFRNSQKHTKNTLIISTPTLYSKKCNYITWTILIFYLIVCVSYLIIFGFWVSMNTSFMWIIYTTLSLLISIFIVDNIYIIGMRLILLKLKQMHVEIVNVSEILRLAERQRRVLFRKFGELLLRPYFKKHYSILKRNDLTLAKHRESSRVDVGNLFKEMCLFIIFIFILYFILLADMDYLIYTSNMQMRKMLIANFSVDALNTIYSIEDVYDYIENTLLPTVHSVNWYGRFNSIEGGQMMDFKSKVLGVVQLRQQRRNQACRIPYTIGDLKILCHNKAPVFKNWAHYNGSDISKSLGLIQMYSGEGYTVLLGRTLYNSYYIMSILKRNNWIDINTKVLFIEFWTYNANFNIFNAVRIIIERSVTGYILTSINVLTARFVQSDFTKEVIIIMAVFLIILIIIIMLTKRIVRIIRRKMGFFKNVWNLLDLIILSLSTVIITLYFLKKVMLTKIIQKLLESDRNDFINYFNLVSVAQANIILSSILLCLSTIKLWKYLRFGMIFQIMELTVKISAAPMFATFGYHLWLLMSFAWYFHIMFGTKVKIFSSVFWSFSYLVATFIDVQQVKLYMPYMTPLSYAVFILYSFMTLTFTTIYVTIILISFKESNNYYSNRKEQYTIKNYFIDEAKYLTEISKTKYARLRAGGDAEDNLEYANTLVYPKGTNERYADSVSVSDTTLKLMHILTMGVIRNVKTGNKIDLKLTETDYKLLARIFIRMFWWKTKDDGGKVLFLRGEDAATKNVQFILDDKMSEMENITKALLVGLQQEETYLDNQMIIHIGYDKRLDTFKETVDTILSVINHIKLV